MAVVVYARATSTKGTASGTRIRAAAQCKAHSLPTILSLQAQKLKLSASSGRKNPCGGAASRNSFKRGVSTQYITPWLAAYPLLQKGDDDRTGKAMGQALIDT